MAELSVRVTWNNKVVLQVRNRLERRYRMGIEPEDAGLSGWRDADPNNPSELKEILLLLNKN